jgi:DNA mismatch endonuclease (patch repair protein)
VNAEQQGSWASSPAVRAVMRGNRKRDTRAELQLRRILHRKGLRYRVARRPLPKYPRTADIVFGGARVAIFVDGCFWHGCEEHYSPPRTNAAYWGPKIARNKARDREVDFALARAGWRTIRVWEHEDPADAASRVADVVHARSAR